MCDSSEVLVFPETGADLWGGLGNFRGKFRELLGEVWETSGEPLGESSKNPQCEKFRIVFCFFLFVWGWGEGRTSPERGEVCLKDKDGWGLSEEEAGREGVCGRGGGGTKIFFLGGEICNEKSCCPTNGRRTAVQVGGALQYKWTVNCMVSLC